MTPCQRASLLGDVPHGFFGRAGGVSLPPFATLNGGPGSGDAADAVAENRSRIAAALGQSALVTAYQTHSATAVAVDAPFETGAAPRADALITDRPGFAIGVLAADCVPILFAGRRFVGAAHAGWRGSLGGIIGATVDLLADAGEDRGALRVAIGPCLRREAFEVGDDLIAAVLAAYPDARGLFVPAATPGKALYDHVGFVRSRLFDAGIAAPHVADVGGCTLSAPVAYFSYRGSLRAGEEDYGRNVSAIAVPGT